MTTDAANPAGYRWTSAEATCAHAYLMPAVRRILVAVGKRRRRRRER